MSSDHELTGYTSALSARPGDRLDVMLGSDSESLAVDVVRVLHGGAIELGPGLELEELPRGDLGTCGGGMPTTTPGSSLRIDGIWGGPAMTLALRVWPTIPGDGRQTLAFLGNEEGAVSLFMDERGCPVVAVTDRGGRISASLSTEIALEGRDWHLVAVSLRRATGQVLLHQRQISGRWPSRATVEGLVGSLPEPGGRLVFGAATPSGRTSSDHFDGKLADPVLLRRALDQGELESLPPIERIPLGSSDAGWDLAAAFGSDVVPGIGRGTAAGHLIGGPTRAVTGPRWRTHCLDWRLDPDGWGAIHFHRDDVDDAGWPASASWKVPADLESGVYAVRPRVGSTFDLLPVVVRHGDRGPTPDVAVLLPTMTYLAYANERLGREMVPPWAAPDWQPPFDPLDALAAAHPEWGASLYDCHRDGSGVSLASFLRPMPNTRPHYRAWFVDAGRHLAADLHLLWWLRQQGVSYHLLTDHDLDAEGVDALRGSRVLLTGSHPEYVTSNILDALEGFAGDGGRLMYLGGNGFYWVTSTGFGEGGHRIEVRRGQAGTRSWESEPGEGHHATSGEPGGLWRHRGRPPGRLVGVGFSSMGWDGKNRPYRRNRSAEADPFGWVFEGIAGEEIAAPEGTMGGPAGDEIDRAAIDHGTPPETMVLATANGFSDGYQLVVEDVPDMQPGMGGTENQDVRADMTITPYPRGGACFAVGSISWSGSLAAAGSEGVSRVTENVLQRFLASDPIVSSIPSSPRSSPASATRSCSASC